MAEPHDPLDVLALPVEPVEPDPAFAAALRTRLHRLLLAPAAPPRPTPPRGGPMTLTPYLAVADARAALAFYTEAFGAVPRGEPLVMPDGRIGHAEIELGGALLMLADEYPELGLVGPASRGGVTGSLHLVVEDVDAVVDRAVAAGAVLERPVDDTGHGRTGVVVDPAGHRWMVQSRSVEASEPALPGRHGDVGYQSLHVPDVDRTRAFFASVLGWTYRGGASEGGWEAVGVRPMTGLMGGADRPEVLLCFQVDDVELSVRRVREAGGSAQEPQDRTHGLLAECVDDQGMRFQVWQPRRGSASADG